MKKITSIAIAVLGLAIMANAQGGFKGVGYDSKFNQVTGRLGISEFASIELGLGMKFDGSQDSSYAKFSTGLSAAFLGHLHEWGNLDSYFLGGILIQKLPQKTDNVTVHLFGGLQPEYTLMDHLAIGLRVGVQMQVAPDVVFETTGEQLDVTSGLRFTLLF